MDTTRAVRAGIAALTLGLLASCAAGPFTGTFYAPGKQPLPVFFRYESSFWGYGGTLTTALPSGETFKGDYRMATRDTEGKMLSTLEGDRGNSLDCRFVLNQPGVGPEAGGTMQCRLSTGGTIDARF